MHCLTMYLQSKILAEVRQKLAEKFERAAEKSGKSEEKPKKKSLIPKPKPTVQQSSSSDSEDLQVVSIKKPKTPKPFTVTKNVVSAELTAHTTKILGKRKGEGEVVVTEKKPKTEETKKVVMSF